MEADDIINNEFLINPTAGRGLSGIATSAEPLLAQGSQLTDIQEVEPGAFVDRTSVTILMIYLIFIMAECHHNNLLLRRLQ